MRRVAVVNSAWCTFEGALGEALRLSQVYATKFPVSAQQAPGPYRVRKRACSCHGIYHWYVFTPDGALPTWAMPARIHS